MSNSSRDKYIQYTPSESALGQTAAKQRIIRMVEMPSDPMEPPKFKHKKVPAGPPSPPVPVMHSPPRKVTVKDQQAWKIPPCISNWKNAKGYTIPLDKRLAADGRSLSQVGTAGAPGGRGAVPGRIPVPVPAAFVLLLRHL